MLKKGNKSLALYTLGFLGAFVFFTYFGICGFLLELGRGNLTTQQSQCVETVKKDNLRLCCKYPGRTWAKITFNTLRESNNKKKIRCPDCKLCCKQRSFVDMSGFFLSFQNCGNQIKQHPFNLWLHSWIPGTNQPSCGPCNHLKPPF